MHLYGLKPVLVVILSLSQLLILPSLGDFISKRKNFDNVKDFNDIVELSDSNENYDKTEDATVGFEEKFEAFESDNVWPSSRIKTDVRNVQNQPIMIQNKKSYNKFSSSRFGPSKGYFFVKKRHRPSKKTKNKRFENGIEPMLTECEDNSVQDREPEVSNCKELFSIFEEIPRIHEMVKELLEKKSSKRMNDTWKSIKLVIMNDPKYSDNDFLERFDTKRCFQNFVKTQRKKRHSTYINLKNQKKKINTNLAKRNIEEDPRFNSIVNFIIKNKMFSDKYTYVPIIFAKAEHSNDTTEHFTNYSKITEIPPEDVKTENSVIETTTSLNTSSNSITSCNAVKNSEPHSSTVNQPNKIIPVELKEKYLVRLKLDLPEEETLLEDYDAASSESQITKSSTLLPQSTNIGVTQRRAFDATNQSSNNRLKKNITKPNSPATVPKEKIVQKMNADNPEDANSSEEEPITLALTYSDFQNVSTTRSNPNVISNTCKTNNNISENDKHTASESTTVSSSTISENPVSIQNNLPLSTVNEGIGSNTPIVCSRASTTPVGTEIENIQNSKSNIMNNVTEITKNILESTIETTQSTIEIGTTQNIAESTADTIKSTNEVITEILTTNLKDNGTEASENIGFQTTKNTVDTTCIYKEKDMIPGILIYPLNKRENNINNDKNKRNIESSVEEDDMDTIEYPVTIEDINEENNFKYVDFNPFVKEKKSVSSDCSEETERMLDVIEKLHLPLQENITIANEDNYTRSTGPQIFHFNETDSQTDNKESSTSSESSTNTGPNNSKPTVLTEEPVNAYKSGVKANDNIEKQMYLENSQTNNSTTNTPGGTLFLNQNPISSQTSTSFTLQTALSDSTNAPVTNKIIGNVTSIIGLEGFGTSSGAGAVLTTERTSGTIPMSRAVSSLVSSMGTVSTTTSCSKSQSGNVKMESLAQDLLLVNEIQRILDGVYRKQSRNKREIFDSSYYESNVTEYSPNKGFSSIGETNSLDIMKKIGGLGKILKLKSNRARRKRKVGKNRKKKRKRKHFGGTELSRRFLGQSMQNYT